MPLAIDCLRSVGNPLRQMTRQKKHVRIVILLLSALRDSAAIRRRQMDSQARGVALRLARSQCPIGRLISPYLSCWWRLP